MRRWMWGLLLGTVACGELLESVPPAPDAAAPDANDGGADASTLDDASAAPDARDETDANVEQDGGPVGPVDLDWAAWPVPAASPAASDYSIADGIVTDSVTGLSWHTEILQPIFLVDAEQHCASSSAGGFSDWRLPSWIELVSINDFSKVNPAIDTTVFPGTPMAFFWSRSAPFTDGAPPPVGDFYHGGISYLTATSPQGAVRCVRGTPAAGAEGSDPSARYTSTAEVVKDRKTGLSWQREVAGNVLLFSEVEAHCAALTLGGWSAGWRAPHIKELLTLVNTKTLMPPRWHQPTFGEEPLRELWTSTRRASDAEDAWVVDFGVAFVSDADTTREALRVRCVHD